jgi:hypothetical protein
VPSSPLRCDKRSSAIRLASAEMLPPVAHGQRVSRSKAIQWCHLILDASRRRLPVEPKESAVQALWDSYKATAKRLRRAPS